ncbi:MAG: PEP-CTERM sorting domain-containing protein [Fimbriimonadaceae bacterium]
MRTILLFVVVAFPFVAAAEFIGSGTDATSYYGGNLFDATVLGASPVEFTGQFGVNAAGNGTESSYDVFFRRGTYVGNDTDGSRWNLLGTWSGLTSPQGTFTRIDVGGTVVAQPGESIGFAIFWNSGDGFLGYRGGASSFLDPNVRLDLGLAKSIPEGGERWNVRTFNPRTWSGEVGYSVVPEPATGVALGAGLAWLASRRRRAK